MTPRPLDSTTIITIVIPVFNEGPILRDTFQEMRRHLDQVSGCTFRIMLINDGSTDDTLSHIQNLIEKDPEIAVLSLTRNFGKEAAIQAGLEHVEDDTEAVIIMDADLQHPPRLIPQMIQIWRNGIDVVEAQKIHRGRESFWSQWLAHGFYRLFQVLTGMNLQNQSDFKLLDRRVLLAYRSLHERERFFRGLVHWMGFSVAHLPFAVPERIGRGGSRWSRYRLWRYSVSALTAFSSAPLHLITLLGGLTFVVSVLFSGKALYDKLFGKALDGFTTVILLQLFIGSTLMISLGLLGIYVAKIHEEVKRRPTYLIDWRKSFISTKKTDLSRESKVLEQQESRNWQYK